MTKDQHPAQLSRAAGSGRELPVQRHRWISTTLHRNGAVSVREIVGRFGVSVATARRDINAVARIEGLRVYGGLLDSRVPPGTPVTT